MLKPCFNQLLQRSVAGLMLTTLVACGNLSASNLPSSLPGDPEIGTQVEAVYLTDFYPPFEVGMKYAYLSTEQKGEAEKSTLLEAEVVETTAEKAKVRITLGGGAANVTEINRKIDPPVLPAGGITFEGREQLTVPAGTFHALKFSYRQNNSLFNAWGEKGVGLVRVLEQKPNGDSVNTVLQAYTR